MNDSLGKTTLNGSIAAAIIILVGKLCIGELSVEVSLYVIVTFYYISCIRT
jgi:hypothetical protein